MDYYFAKLDSLVIPPSSVATLRADGARQELGTEPGTVKQPEDEELEDEDEEDEEDANEGNKQARDRKQTTAREANEQIKRAQLHGFSHFYGTHLGYLSGIAQERTENISRDIIPTERDFIRILRALKVHHFQQTWALMLWQTASHELTHHRCR